jgi:hypothetical protein
VLLRAHRQVGTPEREKENKKYGMLAESEENRREEKRREEKSG